MKLFWLLIFILYISLYTESAEVGTKLLKKYSGIAKEKVITSHKKQSSRLIGGVSTNIKKHPYQVALLINGTFRGSGIILDKGWIATVYSAVRNISPDDLAVRVGSSTYAKGKTVSVRKILKHPKFSVKKLDYDIALLKLKANLRFSRTIKKINIGPGQLRPGNTAVTSGWGQPSINANKPNPYKELKSQIVSHESCKGSYNADAITDSMLCAKSVKSGPCWDDFGNPLVASNKVYGLFSWAADCGHDKYPAVYTDLVSLKSDIKKMMQSNRRKTKTDHKMIKRSIDGNNYLNDDYEDDDGDYNDVDFTTENVVLTEMSNSDEIDETQQHVSFVQEAENEMD